MRMEKLISNFLWNDKMGEHKLHWVSMKKMCYPTEEGGLGLRSIKDIAKAFAIK